MVSSGAGAIDVRLKFCMSSNILLLSLYYWLLKLFYLCIHCDLQVGNDSGEKVRQDDSNQFTIA